MIGLPDVSENKLKLMLLLSDEYGWSNREITDYFNSNNIKTPTNLTYSPKLIWVSMKKYKNRLNRLNTDTILSVKEMIYTEEL